MIILLFLGLLLGSATHAQMAYDPGDWSSYRNFRFARALDAGTHELFVATSGGVLIYELFRQQWQDPVVVGYGTSEPVPIDDAVLLLFDEETGYLWVATRTQLLQYDVNAERWQRVQRDLWGPMDRVVNIGVGGDNLYVETLPAQLFDRLFVPGSPLPLPDWVGFVTRYKGSRSFGSLMMDLDTDPPNDPIEWRGLRTKQALSNDDLYGNLGLPPLNIPALLMPGGWIWQSSGTLLDPNLRPYPVTDWMVDRFGNLWATFWGAGMLKADLRGGRVEMIGVGPGGEDIRALSIGRRDIWMGGLNSGEGQGFSRASADLKHWEIYETRTSSRIRSTELFDIARWDGSVWFATEDGLVEFQEQKGQWKLHTVGEGLQSDHIRALAAVDTELWIGNSSGLAVMGAKGRKIVRVPIPQTAAMEVFRLAIAGDTLYASTEFGLYKAHLEHREFVAAPLDPGLLNAPVLDFATQERELWMATPEGIQVYSETTGHMRSWPAADWMHGAIPTSIAAAGEYVWVGTREHGFYRFHRGSGQWISYTTADGLVDNRVRTLRADGDDLFVGTAAGLSVFYWNRPGRPR